MSPITETPITPGADALARRLSEQLGEAVEAIDPRWSRFAQEGVLIELSIGRERFKHQMTLEDLGFHFATKQEREQVEAVFAPGHLYLIPKERARISARLEEKARENLEKYGFKTFFGRWVHLQAFEAWKAEHDTLLAAFLAERDAIVAEMDRLKQEARAGWRRLLVKNWPRLRSTAAARRDPRFKNRDAWIDGRLAEFEGELPAPAEIVRKFRMEHKVLLIPTTEQVQVDLIKAGDRRLEAAERAVITELQESARREWKGGMGQLMTEVRAQVQGKVFDAVTAALRVARGRDDGLIGRNSSKSLQDMLAAVETLVFWDESGSFAANLDELKRILGTDSEKRSGQELQRVLTSLGAEARLTLMDLDREQERLGIASELVDDPKRRRLSQQVLDRDAVARGNTLGFVEDVGRLEGLIRRPSLDRLDDEAFDDAAPAAVRRAGTVAARADLFDDDAAYASRERVAATA